MTAFEQRRGLVCVAFAAAAFALLLTLVPQEKAGSTRVAAHMAVPAGSASPSLSARWTSWEWPALKHGTGADYVTWSAILPVLFVGLIAPLELKRARLSLCDSRTPSAPILSFQFQRPPPQLA